MFSFLWANEYVLQKKLHKKLAYFLFNEALIEKFLILKLVREEDKRVLAYCLSKTQFLKYDILPTKLVTFSQDFLKVNLKNFL